MKYSVTSTELLWELCNKHDWFTQGSIKQYDKLFYANKHGYSLEEIATIIWLCTDEERWCRRAILIKLEKAKRIYECSCEY